MLRHRIALTGGGTGGHIYPALAVAESLRDDPEVESILYIGVRGHLEERLAKERGLEFVGLDVSGLPRRLSLKLLSWPWQTFKAVLEAKKILRLFLSTAVLGTGGYASAPPLVAAILSSTPFAIHEPDSNPGMVNRLFAGSAVMCSLGMAAAKSEFETRSKHVVVNGNPIRASFVKPLTREEAAKEFGLRADLKTILITGGSQGALAINEATREALPRLLAARPELQILHQVGEKNIEAYRQTLAQDLLENPRYCLKSYIDDLAIAYAASDLTVCRAGAMTIAELLVMNTPAVFVPYPFAAQNHQMHNGRFMESQGCAQVLPQNELSGDRLGGIVLNLIRDDSRLNAMRKAGQLLAKPNAAKDIARQLKEIGTSHAKESSREEAR